MTTRPADGPTSGSDALAGVLYLDTTPRRDRRRVSLGYGAHGSVDADCRVRKRGRQAVRRAIGRSRGQRRHQFRPARRRGRRLCQHHGAPSRRFGRRRLAGVCGRQADRGRKRVRSLACPPLRPCRRRSADRPAAVGGPRGCPVHRQRSRRDLVDSCEQPRPEQSLRRRDVHQPDRGAARYGNRRRQLPLRPAARQSRRRSRAQTDSANGNGQPVRRPQPTPTGQRQEPGRRIPSRVVLAGLVRVGAARLERRLRRRRRLPVRGHRRRQPAVVCQRRPRRQESHLHRAFRVYPGHVCRQSGTQARDQSRGGSGRCPNLVGNNGVAGLFRHHAPRRDRRLRLRPRPGWLHGAQHRWQE